MKHSILNLPTLVLTGALGFVAGCSTVNTIEPAQPAVQQRMIADKRLITDPNLAQSVCVKGLFIATSGGLMQVQFQLQNRSSHTQSFVYEIDWFDEHGMLIHLPSKAPIPRTLAGGEGGYITATAPTPQAKNFRLRLLAR